MLRIIVIKLKEVYKGITLKTIIIKGHLKLNVPLKENIRNLNFIRHKIFVRNFYVCIFLS